MENTVLAVISRQMGIEREMDAIANNIANASTDGFKSERMMFAEYLQDIGNNQTMAVIKVAGVIRAHQADILFVPYFEDAHPDHRAVTRSAEDARFDAKLTGIDMPIPTGVNVKNDAQPIYPRWLFYYYCTHLRWVADPSFLFDITGCVERKIESIKAYHTQFVLPEKNRRVVEWVEHAASYFGSRIGTEAAEPFFTKEPLGLCGLESLVL